MGECNLSSVSHPRLLRQLASCGLVLTFVLLAVSSSVLVNSASAQDLPPTKAENSEAKTEKEMKAYTDQIPGT
jgi:hypothetical protein